MVSGVYHCVEIVQAERLLTTKLIQLRSTMESWRAAESMGFHIAA